MQVRTTLDYFHITDYFDHICGATLDESRSGKKEVLEELIRRIGLTEEQLHKEVLMIGDRKHDVEGAAVFGIPCLGTSMGFAVEGGAGVSRSVGSCQQSAGDDRLHSESLNDEPENTGRTRSNIEIQNVCVKIISRIGA